MGVLPDAIVVHVPRGRRRFAMRRGSFRTGEAAVRIPTWNSHANRRDLHAVNLVMTPNYQSAVQNRGSARSSSRAYAGTTCFDRSHEELTQWA